MHSSEAGWSGGLAWRKSSLCAGGECVEVAQRSSVIVVRDSSRPQSGILQLNADAWRSFIAGIKADNYQASGS
jgi:hypothetical protein